MRGKTFYTLLFASSLVLIYLYAIKPSSSENLWPQKNVSSTQKQEMEKFVKNERPNKNSSSQPATENGSAPSVDRVQVIELSDLDVSRLESAQSNSDFGKTYYKVAELEFSATKEKKYKIKFTQELRDVASVVVVAKWGALTPYVFKVNEETSMTFKKGQNLYTDDWFKLDDSNDAGLKSISLSGLSLEGVSMVEIYIQKL